MARLPDSICAAAFSIVSILTSVLKKMGENCEHRTPRRLSGKQIKHSAFDDRPKKECCNWEPTKELVWTYHFSAQRSCVRAKTSLAEVARLASMVCCRPDAMPTSGRQPSSFSARLQSNCMRAMADLTR